MYIIYDINHQPDTRNKMTTSLPAFSYFDADNRENVEIRSVLSWTRKT